MAAAEPTRRGPLCKHCLHYYITHDVSFPYGCRALDFKSRRPPIHAVQAASGQACLYFRAKPHSAD